MGKIKKMINHIPLIGNGLSGVLYRNQSLEFRNSNQYWIDRYKQKGNSGAGSYNNLAEFKAEVLNDFVKTNNISSVIEFGCGDGNQMQYFDFPQYAGFDISAICVERCKQQAAKLGKNYEFAVLSDYQSETAELILSLDVIYHLIEDEVFYQYMQTLFAASRKYVIIYASNKNEIRTIHVHHRKFTDWIAQNAIDFQLVKHIPNKYPYDENNPDHTSFADFYVFERK